MEEEKLTVARLQRELTKTKTDNNQQRDAIMRDLAEERQSRLDAEKRLKDALLEGETYKSRLEVLQEDLTKMQGMLNSVMEYKSKMEQMKEEHGGIVMTLENELKKCHAHISNLERENSNLLSECHVLESKVGHEEIQQEKTMLLERLRLLEAENSALVLENENQRDQYERCLDEVANQVVQALLMQKDLKEECMKLHRRVRELEQQNRNLKFLFERERQCCGPAVTPLQSCFQHPFANLSSPGLNNPTLSSSSQSQGLAPPAGSSSSPMLIRPSNRIPDTRGRPEQLGNGVGGSGEGLLPTDSSHPGCEPSQGSPGHGANPFLYHPCGSMQLRSPQTHFPTIPHPDHINISQTADPNYHVNTSGGHPVDAFGSYALPTMQDGSLDMLSPQREQMMFAHNCQAYAEYRHGRLSESNGHAHQSSMISFNVAENDVSDGAGEMMGLEDLEWEHTMLSPASQRHLSEMGKSGRHLSNGVVTSPAKALAFRNCYGSAVADRKLGGGLVCREAGRNGFSLGEQYTKPFVHAPFHYAQSLLQELKDISSSVKSFESLTLEPKAGVQQKRKASLEGHSPQSRQKVVRCQPGRPPDHIIAVSSSDQVTSYDAGPSLARTSGESSGSMTSSESIETMLERQASITPFPDSRMENGNRGKHQYSEQQKLPSRDVDSQRVHYQNSQADLSTDSTPSQYFKAQNNCSSQEKPHHIPESQLNHSHSSVLNAGKSPQSPRIDRNAGIYRSLQNRDFTVQQKTNTGRNLHDTSQQTLVVQRNTTMCNSSQTLDTLVPGRDEGSDNFVANQSPTMQTNVMQPTNDTDSTKFAQIVTQLPPQSLAIHRNKPFQNNAVNPPQSRGVAKNVAMPKQSCPLSSARNNNTQANNLLNSHGPNLQRADHSARTASSPSRHRNVSFPKPHRHLSEPNSSSSLKRDTAHFAANPSASPSSILPPKTLSGELSSQAINRHRQTSSAPTSPSNDRLAARVHQRNVARKMSPRVCRPDAINKKQNENKTEGTGNSRTAHGQPVRNSDAEKQCSGPDLNNVSHNANKAPIPRDNMAIRPVDLIIPSKETKLEKLSSTDRLASKVEHKKVTRTHHSPEITDKQVAKASEETRTAPKEKSASQKLKILDQLIHSSASSNQEENILPLNDMKCKQGSAERIETLIAMFSSNQERSSQDVKVAPKVPLVDLFNEGNKQSSVEETEVQKDNSVLDESQDETKETGKKSQDNRVGSFMRATLPPVVSAATRKSFEDSSIKPPITNIDELPVRGYSGLDTADSAVSRRAKLQEPKEDKELLKEQEASVEEQCIQSASMGDPTSTQCQLRNTSPQTAEEAYNEVGTTKSKSGERLTADDSDIKSARRQSPLHIGTLDSSPRQLGRNQPASAAGILDGHKRVMSDTTCKKSQSYESLQSNQSEGSVDWGSPIRMTTKKPATPLSDILWSGSDSDDEEEANVNFVEMWKSRSSSPMKLPDWNPRKSVEDYKKKMRDSLTSSTPRSLERPDSLTSSTSSEQWILNYPFDKVTPPQTLNRPTKTSSLKESSTKKTINEMERVKDLKVAEAKTGACVTKSSPPVRMNGSMKRETADGVKKDCVKKNGERVRSSGSENSSLGENSLMADFVSSILTEISSDEFGKSCNSLDSGLKGKNKAMKSGKGEKKISPGTRSKWNSLPSNHSRSLALPVSANSKNPQTSKDKVSKTRSAEAKATKTKSKEQKRKDSLSGIPKAITEKNFKFYRGQSSRGKSVEQEGKENSSSIVELVKKREPKGRSRIPKLIRNSFKSQKSSHSDNSIKKKSSKGFSKKSTSQDDHKIQMTCNVPSDPSRRWNSLTRCDSDTKERKNTSAAAGSLQKPSNFGSEDMPFMDETGTGSPSDKQVVGKCNLCSEGVLCSACSQNSQKATKSSKESLKAGDRVQVSVWEKTKGDHHVRRGWKPTSDAANQRLIHDIERGHLVGDFDPEMNPKKWTQQLNSNNKGSMEMGLHAKERLEGKVKGSEGGSKEFKVPLVNEDMMEDFDAEELCDEGSESARENSAQLTEKERANLLDSLFESETDEDDEGGESLDTSSDSHPDEKQFLKLLGGPGGDRVSGWKRQVVRPQAMYCHVSILQLDLQALYMRFGEKEKEALSSFGFLRREELELEDLGTPLSEQMNNNANDLQFSLAEAVDARANICRSSDQRGPAFNQAFDESLSASDDVSCYSQSSSTPSLSLHD
ncbi:uncharacterized protein LOC117291297 isoform X1 [Asterias rubens]|uniref:uncharacterized protein LOC117291297 isoform X1 n=1 Tax=Asterias rubens TaxID=7604 RepID=UPI001455480A|nr:uncharacterized protein LOC117291297 isoform X1 [Asterias rubens]